MKRAVKSVEQRVAERGCESALEDVGGEARVMPRSGPVNFSAESAGAVRWLTDATIRFPLPVYAVQL